VDVFDALTSDRPYRRAMTPDEALGILRESAGKQFDPQLVSLFAEILPEVSAEIRKLAAAGADPEPSPKTLNDSAFAHAQIRKAAAEMAAVCDVAHSLAEQESLDQVSSVVVDRAMALLPSDTAVLYLRSSSEVLRSRGSELEEPGTQNAEPGDALVAAAVLGKYEEKLRGMTIQMGEGVAGAVATSQQPRVNVSAAPDIARRFSPEEMMELSAATAVPVVHGPEVLGVLVVYTMAYSVVTEHHLHLLNILAEHAASAIQNSRRRDRQRELAYTDPLTGLANSRHLIRHLDRLTRTAVPLESLGAPPFTVVMVDLDGFKEVNDTLGHLWGDELLGSVGQMLSGVARDNDVVCRYAGDEFVLLLQGVGREASDAVLERVREAIALLGPVDGRVKVGASVGAATFPFDGLDARTLLNVADARMYEDKFQRRRLQVVSD
jgi:diguanylate cyclase (GGDEF)-like protein